MSSPPPPPTPPRVPVTHLLHAAYANDTLRRWHVPATSLAPHNFVLPLFISDAASGSEAISSMPGVWRYSVAALPERVQQWCADGLAAVLLFGVVRQEAKDDTGSLGESDANPVCDAVRLLRKRFPDLTVMCDVCLCDYTSHGHCGVLRPDGAIDNEASVAALARQALAYARAGAQVVAPSDMMDGRVGAIKALLHTHGLASATSVLSYSAKFTSALYGPFRDAVGSAPAFGDRRCYQLPPCSLPLALRATQRDVTEGADMLMVKPGMPHLAVLSAVKQQHPHHPLFVYQVSGEYSLLLRGTGGTEPGDCPLLRKLLMTELFPGFRVAGADVIISYFTPWVLRWLREERAGA